MSLQDDRLQGQADRQSQKAWQCCHSPFSQPQPHSQRLSIMCLHGMACGQTSCKQGMPHAQLQTQCAISMLRLAALHAGLTHTGGPPRYVQPAQHACAAPPCRSSTCPGAPQPRRRYATVSTSCPSLVMRMVCSYCAASLPSAVTTVQASLQVCAARQAAYRMLCNSAKLELDCRFVLPFSFTHHPMPNIGLIGKDHHNYACSRHTATRPRCKIASSCSSQELSRTCVHTVATS